MAKVDYRDKRKLVTQAQNEYQSSLEYKRPRITEWKLNEDALNGRKFATKDSRANQSFGLAHKLVHTMLAKIDEPLTFEYERGELGDTRKVELFNALKDKYKKIGRWDFIDRLGKYNAIVYGNAIYQAYGEQDDNGEFVFVNKLIDPEDFFIDTNVRIDEPETARYMGWWGLKLNRKQLSKLKDDPNYDKSAIKDLLEGDGTNDNTRQDVDKRNRQYSLGVWKSKDNPKDIWEFYTWITTGDDGERYYLVFTEDGACIRCQKWTDIQKSGMYPIWFWASYPEPFEFWSRGPLEIARLTLDAQERSLNQLLDNAEMINRPQRLVNVNKVRNSASLKYKKDGLVEIVDDGPLQDAFATVQTPPLQTPIETNNILQSIVNAVTGVTDEVQGVANDQGKVGVVEQNLAQANDRFALMQDSYEQGYYRLAVLFREAVKQHMTKSTLVKVMGNKGYTFVNMSPKSIKMHDNDFDVMVTSSSKVEAQNLRKSAQKVAYLSQWLQSGILNLNTAFEEGAEAVGWTQEEIQRMMDKENYTSNEARSYAEENVQRILKGEEPVMYYDATETYLNEMKRLITVLADEIRKKPEVAVKIQEHLGKMMFVIGENNDAMEGQAQDQFGAQQDQAMQQQMLQPQEEAPLEEQSATPM